MESDKPPRRDNAPRPWLTDISANISSASPPHGRADSQGRVIASLPSGRPSIYRSTAQPRVVIILPTAGALVEVCGIPKSLVIH